MPYGANAMLEHNPYVILGISRDATADEVKSAYRNLAKQYHPDTNDGDTRAADRFRRIADAYEILSDPLKRARYDRHLPPRRPPPPQPAPQQSRPQDRPPPAGFNVGMLTIGALVAVIPLVMVSLPAAQPDPGHIEDTPPPQPTTSAAAVTAENATPEVSVTSPPAMAQPPPTPVVATPVPLPAPAGASESTTKPTPPPARQNLLAQNLSAGAQTLPQPRVLPPPPPAFSQPYPIIRRLHPRLFFYRWMRR